MPTAQKMISNPNVFHPPQYIIEGTGPSNYGKNIEDGTMTVPLQMSKMDVGYNNEFVTRLFKGEFDLEDEIKVWEDDVITLMGNVPINNAGLGLLDWCLNKPPLFYNDATTDDATTRKPHQSRTWVWSYINSDNKAVYFVAKGCKPRSARLSIPNKGLADLEIAMTVHRLHVITNPTAITINTDGTPQIPVNESALTETAHSFKGSDVDLVAFESKSRPLRYENALDFFYKPVGKSGSTPAIAATPIQYESIEVGVDWELREQNSNGTIRSVFKEQSGRSGSGNVAIYKTGQEYNEDARTDWRRVAWFPLSSGTDVHAKATIATDVIFFAGVPGAAGNGIKIEVNAKSGTANKIEVSGRKITITPKSATPTWAEIKTDLDNNREASLLGSLAIKGTPTAPALAISEMTTAGGTDGARKIILNKFRFEPSNEQFQGQTAATIENKTYSSFEIISKNIL